MADRPGGEPTEAPTPKRLRDARRRGEVARSTEAVSAGVFFVAILALYLLGPYSLGQLGAYLHAGIRQAAAGNAAPAAVLSHGLDAVLRVSAPLLFAVIMAALLANFAQVGALFSLHPVKPALSKINPISNAKNLFGKKALFELCKSTVKAVGVGYLAFDAIWDHAPAILAATGRRPEVLLAVVSACMGTIALRVGLMIGALALIDLLYQRMSFFKRMKMTKEEVKREQKEAEGEPQHKAERQRLHREMLEHRMLERVAEADCVLINPTRLAVAIRYDATKMDAPQVVARGRRLVAAKIREIARQHGIPIVRNVSLAQALVDLELDEEIPAELYEAVAEVLRFVYRITGRERD